MSNQTKSIKLWFRNQLTADFSVLPVGISLLFLSIIFQTLNHRFLSGENLANLISQNVPLALIATGSVLMLLIGEIDLSVGVVSGLCASVVITLNVTKDALRALAELAAKKGTGARALRSMLERIMLDVMYDIPSREDVSEVTVNRGVVEGKRGPTVRRKQDKDAA